ncbi:hypothetical protein MATL_G00220070 [Megalops atlanticus]|uniref:Ig-like domain-containing protein n=1 Tax=Megalops atlanticus TaxID=7932 RepID=A0A9D3T3Z8_MEGAT|nr:hypothetical protein MATL_G00220070 [Megalops atlanticus]
MEGKSTGLLLTATVLLELQLFSSGMGECPVQLHPSSLLVRYGDSASANCTVSEGHLGIGWEASEGSVDMEQDVQFLTWRVENLTDWHIEPKCFGNFMNDIGQCLEALQVTLYKTPDSVSIRSVDHTGPMVEGRQYQLQCEVQNIAPVQNLTVKWYRGESLENETTFNSNTKTPMTVSSTLTITPSRDDNGAQYSCVAELELGPEGPQPPPEVASKPLKITVHYKPSITKCANQEELKEGDFLGALLFIAEGNPAPRVTWYRDQSEINSSTPLTRKDSGQYVLTARNSLGSSNCTLSLTVSCKGDTCNKENIHSSSIPVCLAPPAGRTGLLIIPVMNCLCICLGVFSKSSSWVEL